MSAVGRNTRSRQEYPQPAGIPAAGRNTRGQPRISSITSAEIDGIFCQNDRRAIGAIKAVHEERLRIPEDISIVGFDDLPIAAHLTPFLPTVAHPAEALGRATVKALLREIEPEAPIHEDDTNDEESLKTKLIVRDSTKHITE